MVRSPRSTEPWPVRRDEAEAIPMPTDKLYGAEVPLWEERRAQARAHRWLRPTVPYCVAGWTASGASRRPVTCSIWMRMTWSV